MTLQHLKENREQIIAKYYELGGISSLLKEFMVTLKESIDFDLNDGIQDVDMLVKKWFNERYKGVEQKKNLSDIVNEIHEKNGNYFKKYNPLSKSFE